MEQLPADIPLSFEVTFDPGLSFVAARIYDDSGGSPVLVATTPMTEVDSGTYRCKFTGMPNKNYIVKKGVFTDGTYAVYNTNYSWGSESFVCIAFTTTVINIGSKVPDASIINPAVLAARLIGEC